jgi:hypothetical protein
MKNRHLNFRRRFMVTMLTGIFLSISPTIVGILPKVSALTCTAGQPKLLGIVPPWHEYLGDAYGSVASNNKFVPAETCGIVKGEVTDHAVKIGLAIIDMLLRAGALVAVAFVMMGGYKYMSSQGEPKNIEGAMATIINAAIGLGIVVTAIALVSFIGNRVGG